MAWWKYDQPEQITIRNDYESSNPGGLLRNIPEPVSIPTYDRQTTVPIPVSIPNQTPRIGPVEPTSYYTTTPVPPTELPIFTTSTFQSVRSSAGPVEGTPYFTAPPVPSTEVQTVSTEKMNYQQPYEIVDPTYDPNKIPTFVPKTDTTPVPETPLPSFSQTQSAGPEPTETSHMANSRLTNPTDEPRTVTERSITGPLLTETVPGKTETPYMTNSQMTNPKNEHEIVTEIGTRTPVPSTAPLTFSQPRRPTRRPTRKPITTTSVQTTTTKSKTLQVEFWKDTSVESEKYQCNLFGYKCKWRPTYKKILNHAQGR